MKETRFLLTFLAAFCVPAVAQGEPAEKAVPTSLELSSELEEIYAGRAPKNVAELRAMQDHTRKLLAKILPCTVSIGGATGVVVPGGYVLSAAHVTRTVGRRLTMVTHDGRRIRGETLGANHRTDAGLIKITSDGDHPCLEMGKSVDLEPGQWCAMLGHPGGRKRGLKPPLRVGRILRTGRTTLISDCTMSSGDSGGPLVDMQGRVIGINSRIMTDLAVNMHVPIDAFRSDWEDFVAGKSTGTARGAYLGVQLDPESDAARVVQVMPNTAAARAGLKAGDVIRRVSGRRVGDMQSLQLMLRNMRPGQSVRLEVRRGGESVVLNARLGRRQ